MCRLGCETLFDCTLKFTTVAKVDVRGHFPVIYHFDTLPKLFEIRKSKLFRKSLDTPYPPFSIKSTLYVQVVWNFIWPFKSLYSFLNVYSQAQLSTTLMSLAVISFFHLKTMKQMSTIANFP